MKYVERDFYLNITRHRVSIYRHVLVDDRNITHMKCNLILCSCAILFSGKFLYLSQFSHYRRNWCVKSERLLNALSDVRYISNVLPESKVNLLEQDKRYNISPFHRLVFI